MSEQEDFEEYLMEQLKGHLGHYLTVALYGNDLALECQSCGEIIIDEQTLREGSESAEEDRDDKPWDY